MHVVIEKARKAAGIGSMQKNYPENSRERGCGFWAAFVGVIGDQLASIDAERIADQRTIADLSKQNAELEHQLTKAMKGKVQNGVESLALSEGWSKEKQTTVMNKIAG